MGAGFAAALLAAPGSVWAGDPALEGPREELAALEAGRRPPPAETLAQWQVKQRRLRVQVGVSASLTAAFLLTGILVLTAQLRCSDPDPDFGCGEGFGVAITAGLLFPAAAIAAIPTAVYGVRLTRHNARRPVAQLQMAPGGLRLRF